jgi:uncharacterized protein YecE (DUF72 family)
MTVVRGNLYAGASGFSYASWRGGFYPEDARPEEFLHHYAKRLPAVELLATYRRLPSEEQLDRWARATPASFRFSVRLPRRIVDGDLASLAPFLQRLAALDGRLGALVARLPDGRPRDDGLLRFLLGSIDPELRLALDPRHPSWEVPEVDRALADAGAVRVGVLETDVSFRYLRLRDPPYADDALEALAGRIRPCLDAGVDVFAFFRHEDEPRAPHHAERLASFTG